MSQTLVIDFGGESEYQYGLQVYVDKNPCTPGDIVNIYVYAANSTRLQNVKIYKESESLGTGTSGSETDSKEETIKFEDFNTSKLSEPISSINSSNAASALLYYSSDGFTTEYSKGASLTLNVVDDIGVNIDNCKNVYGSVYVDYTYKKHYKKYPYTVSSSLEEDTEIPFFLEDNGQIVDNFFLKVIVSQFEEIPVDIIIKDIANDSLISNATVEITESFGDNPQTFEQTTDSNGKCTFTLKPGKTYTSKITHDDYIDSDLDRINNDTFTVPIDETEESE